MTNEKEKSKKFVIDAIKMYRNLGKGAQIKLKVGDKRNFRIDKATNTIYITALGEEEAEQIKIMYNNERNFEPNLESYGNIGKEMNFQRMYHHEIDDFDEEKTSKIKSEKEDFKTKLKYNIDERDDSKKVKQKNKSKRNIKNIAKTIKHGGRFIADKYNRINISTKRRILALIGSAMAIYSIGSVAHDIGKANAYVENSNYTSVEEAVDGEQELLKAEFEKLLEEELGEDVKVVAKESNDPDSNSPIVAVQNSYGFNYKIPNEMKEILKDIPRDGNGYITDRMRLCDLLNTRKKMEKYFEENNFSIEKNEGLGIEDGKIVQSKTSEQEVR